MSKRTRKKVRNIVFSILSFVLALFLFIDIICVFTAVFAINENRWIDQMNASNYFKQACCFGERERSASRVF